MWKWKHINNGILLNWCMSPVWVLLHFHHQTTVSHVLTGCYVSVRETVLFLIEQALNRLSGGTLICSAYPSWVCTSSPKTETVYAHNGQTGSCFCLYVFKHVWICVHTFACFYSFYSNKLQIFPEKFRVLISQTSLYSIFIKNLAFKKLRIFLQTKRRKIGRKHTQKNAL